MKAIRISLAVIALVAVAIVAPFIAAGIAELHAALACIGGVNC
jgi:hypothetical protein